MTAPVAEKWIAIASVAALGAAAVWYKFLVPLGRLLELQEELLELREMAADSPSTVDLPVPDEHARWSKPAA